MVRNGSRQALLSRMSQLPQDIQAGIKNQSLQVSDHGLYAVRSISGTNRAQMFKDDDNKVIGRSNISSGKLEKGGMFGLIGIRLQFGVCGDTNDNPDSVSFGALPDFIRNGEFELRGNNASIISQAPVELFNTAGNNELVTSTLMLDSPKVLRDLTAIEFNVEWANTIPAAQTAKAWLKVVFIGATIVKA